MNGCDIGGYNLCKPATEGGTSRRRRHDGWRADTVVAGFPVHVRLWALRRADMRDLSGRGTDATCEEKREEVVLPCIKTLTGETHWMHRASADQSLLAPTF